MNVVSPNLLASISPSSIGSVAPAVFGNGFVNASAITVSQSSNITSQQLRSMTTASVQALSVACFAVLQTTQVVGFTADQVKVMSTDQITALPIESKIIILGTQYNSISPLNINLTAFNTLLTSPYFASSKTSPEVVLQHDAVVSVNMPISSAQSMFKYQHSSDGTTRLYFDKSQFAVKYIYGASSNAVKDIKASMYPSEPTLFGDYTFTYGNGLKWDGPVTSNSTPGDTNIAMSWDYILYTSQSVFNNWSLFTYFNDLYSSEKAFRDALNLAVNTQINPVLEAVDLSNNSVPGATISKIFDPSGNNYFTILQGSSTADNISSTVFDYMYSHQPQRFIAPTDSENVSYAFPFITGDTLNFLVTVNANPKQTILETNTSGSTSAALVKTRTYLMKITIV
jgi:hypothetical protein